LATALAPLAKPRLRLTLIIVLLILLIVPSGYLWLNPYLDAASVLLRVSDPQSNDWLARHDTNPITISDTEIQTPAGVVRGRIYLPVGVSNPPAMVVLHGVNHLGIDKPRLVNFSRALSMHGVLVMTPELTDLADYHVELSSIDVIGSAARDLKARTGATSVAVLGLSFAGGLALVAAAEPRYRDDISVVISIGGYDSLPRVLRFFAANTIEEPNGAAVPMQAHEYGILVVVYAHPEDFFSPADVPVAREAIRQQLYEKPSEAGSLAQRLSPVGHARMEELLAHKDDGLSADLLRSLADHKAEAEAVSPAGKLAQLRADVLLAHGEGDNVIPPAELLWLKRDVPVSKLKAALISPVISHVELGGHPSFADEWRLVHFMKELLRDCRKRARSHHELSPAPRLAPATSGTH
jgi:pimeloyl-ACP methyl ester carboxylesterase